MRILLIVTFLLISFYSIGQDCEKLFSEDKFTKDKKAYFYMAGNGDFKPYVELTVEINGDKSYSNQNISIKLSAGTGKKDEIGMRDYSSLTLKYVSNKDNNTMLYFLFEDGKSFYLTGSSQVVYGNSVYLNKDASPELVTYFKSKKITDIRFTFNTIQADYKIPIANDRSTESTWNYNSNSNQNFFINIMRCIGW